MHVKGGEKASSAEKEGNRKDAGEGGTNYCFIPEPVLCRFSVE